MFDSQKLSFDKWLTGYKHGVYVFTSDSCAICLDYKKSIEDIDNRNVYFVDVELEAHKDILSREIMRNGLPQTVCYENNDIKLIRSGMLFDLQMAEIYKFLEPFGKDPLPKDELEKRAKALKNKCVLTYYIFPPKTSEEVREKWMSKAEQYNELPIDVDKVGTLLDLDLRERMFSGNYVLAKMVIFDDGNTKVYSDFAQRLILGHSIANKDAKFIKRDINEEKTND